VVAGFPRGLAYELPDAAGAGVAELPPGDGAGDEAAGGGLLAGAGLPVGDGLLVGEGATDGDGTGELTGDGGSVGVATGTGSVARAVEVGNRVMTGSAGAGLCLVADGAGAGVESGEAATRMPASGWLAGPTAALFATVAGKPTELVGPRR
jgi:hypothetical protein